MMRDYPDLRTIATHRGFRGLRIGFWGFLMELIAFVVFACGLETLGISIAFLGVGAGVTGVIFHVTWMHQNRKPH